jgi:hypothetical protein
MGGLKLWELWRTLPRNAGSRNWISGGVEPNNKWVQTETPPNPAALLPQG